MKYIIAYIKPHKLEPVSMALHKVEGLTGMSVTDVRGFGRGRGNPTLEEQLYELVPHKKIELVCLDELADEIISAIQTNAYTGLRGDGKIYVLEVVNALRISTGEMGEKAV
ncbi:MAG: P-II family nitrogen regulator [Calditrichaeota bacterium]|jgi:nitrogen regulatory protein PII|nr:MAG: P-II family nitrogen regulator [Calditrichota bacterium]